MICICINLMINTSVLISDNWVRLHENALKLPERSPKTISKQMTYFGIGLNSITCQTLCQSIQETIVIVMCQNQFQSKFFPYCNSINRIFLDWWLLEWKHNFSISKFFYFILYIWWSFALILIRKFWYCLCWLKKMKDI